MFPNGGLWLHVLVDLVGVSLICLTAAATFWVLTGIFIW